jgi:TetR/AcrR family transcriptional repressor of nem operon
MKTANTIPAPHQSRLNLLNAALHIIRQKGYAATTVDDICAEAGVSKGSFFHHFKSKDALAIAAVEYWEQMTGGLFAAAEYQQGSDPLDRLLGYVDFRLKILGGELADFTCLLGTLVQETYETHPEIRSACLRALESHIELLTVDAAAAKELYAPEAEWTPESVASFIQAVLQGSFIFAKAHGGPEVARLNIDHLRRYVISLFPRTRKPKSRRNTVPARALKLKNSKSIKKEKRP